MCSSRRSGRSCLRESVRDVACPRAGSSRRRVEQPHDAVARPSTCRCPTRRPARAPRRARASARRRRPRATCVEVLDEALDLEHGRRSSTVPYRLPGVEAGRPVPRADGVEPRHLLALAVRARAARRERARVAAAAPATARRRGSPAAARRCSGGPERGSAASSPVVYGCCGCANSSPDGASSTLRPAYMTITRSATSATTPRSWVMRTIAVPRRSRMSRIRSRMPAWIVTSSAVVGSSAISTFGLQATAIAIITRWRMPPESWCGYSSIRRVGAGMPTSSSSSIVAVARLRAVEPEVVAQHLADLAADREDRVQRRHRLLEDERDLPPAHLAQGRFVGASAGRGPRSAALPDSCAEAGSSRSIDIAVTLLPQPDSPTIASTSPASSENDTRSTACTEPSSVSKRTESSSTSSSAISASSSGRGRRAGRRRAG